MCPSYQLLRHHQSKDSAWAFKWVLIILKQTWIKCFSSMSKGGIIPLTIFNRWILMRIQRFMGRNLMFKLMRDLRKSLLRSLMILVSPKREYNLVIMWGLLLWKKNAVSLGYILRIHWQSVWKLKRKVMRPNGKWTYHTMLIHIFAQYNTQISAQIYVSILKMNFIINLWLSKMIISSINQVLWDRCWE